MCIDIYIYTYIYVYGVRGCRIKINQPIFEIGTSFLSRSPHTSETRSIIRSTLSCEQPMINLHNLKWKSNKTDRHMQVGSQACTPTEGSKKKWRLQKRRLSATLTHQNLLRARAAICLATDKLLVNHFGNFHSIFHFRETKFSLIRPQSLSLLIKIYIYVYTARMHTCTHHLHRASESEKKAKRTSVEGKEVELI